MLFAQAVFIKAKLFTLMSTKAVILIPYPFQNTIHGTIKYFPPIS